MQEKEKKGTNCTSKESNKTQHSIRIIVGHKSEDKEIQDKRDVFKNNCRMMKCDLIWIVNFKTDSLNYLKSVCDGTAISEVHTTKHQNKRQHEF